MAKITFYGLSPAHSLIYGLKHKYIDKKLTIKNWKRKAIVRNGKYIYIQKGREYVKNGKDKIIFTVFINENERCSFKTIKECIDFANSYHKTEGKYPAEFSPGWHIGPIMKFPKIKNN